MTASGWKPASRDRVPSDCLPRALAFPVARFYNASMRIIAGRFRHRPLLTPPGLTTRPITDRAKQSLFDALSAAVDFDGINVLDCFAGPGSMGLECLSRGAAAAIFVERDRAALAALRKNIAALDVESMATVLAADAYRLAPGSAGLGKNLALAFVDPPYAHMETGHQRALVDGLVAGLAREAMAPEGVIILRHPAGVSVDVAALRVTIARELRYGEMAVTWLKAAAN